MSADQPAEPVRPRVPSTAIVELRQYTLHPGQRDVLIELFDREFIESQEEVGMTVIAQYRDLDRPNHFVWLRGFPDMKSRATSLTAFYDGPVWRAHAQAANGTMIDSDNVLLLEPASPETTLTPAPRMKAAVPSEAQFIAITIYYPRVETKEFALFFARSIRPLVVECGAAVLGEYRISAQPTNFRLPVREGEKVFVWFASFANAADHGLHRDRLAKSDAWRRTAAQLETQLARPTETLRLVATSRSRHLK